MRRTPGRDYPIGTTYQPDEPVLQMTVDHLAAAANAARTTEGRRGVHVFDDFIVYNDTGRWVLLRQLVRMVLRNGLDRAGARLRRPKAVA